jgi:sugar/nucleoside kinase (ribokinase family)
VSVVANDSNGTGLLEHVESAGVTTKGVKVVTGGRTATYTAVHDDVGELVAAVADMGLIAEQLTADHIEHRRSDLLAADIVVCDGNISPQTFEKVADICDYGRITLVFDCTSDAKASLPLLAGRIGSIDIIKPNQSELSIILNFAKRMYGPRVDANYTTIEDEVLREALVLQALLKLVSSKEYLVSKDKHVLVSLGSRGLLWVGPRHSFLDEADAKHLEGDQAYMFLPSALKPTDVMVNSSGAGDCFLAGVTSGLASNRTRGLNADIIRRGLLLSRESLLSESPVPEWITTNTITSQ